MRIIDFFFANALKIFLQWFIAIIFLWIIISLIPDYSRVKAILRIEMTRDMIGETRYLSEILSSYSSVFNGQKLVEEAILYAAKKNNLTKEEVKKLLNDKNLVKVKVHRFALWLEISILSSNPILALDIVNKIVKLGVKKLSYERAILSEEFGVALKENHGQIIKEFNEYIFKKLKVPLITSNKIQSLLPLIKEVEINYSKYKTNYLLKGKEKINNQGLYVSNLISSIQKINSIIGSKAPNPLEQEEIDEAINAIIQNYIDILDPSYRRYLYNLSFGAYNLVVEQDATILPNDISNNKLIIMIFLSIVILILLLYVHVYQITK